MSIGLYLVVGLPLFTGLVVAFLVDRTRGTRFEVRGIVGPYFGAVAVIFAINASLMTDEIWKKIQTANLAISQEADALRAMLRLANAIGDRADPLRETVHDYVSAVQAQGMAMEEPHTRGPTHDGITRLYRFAADGSVFQGNAHLTQAFIVDLDRLRSARTQRYNLAHATASIEKLATVFIFGLVTQIAIALVHVAHRRAIFVTVGLFSVAFATLFGVIALFDRPFDQAYLINKIPLLDINPHIETGSIRPLG